MTAGGSTPGFVSVHGNRLMRSTDGSGRIQCDGKMHYPGGGGGGGGTAPSLVDGKVFYVDSNDGASGNSGEGPDNAVATIDQAVDLCTASRGDLIIVAEGHAESISAAAGLDLDVAGITVRGLGNGRTRPTITFATDTAADIDVDAANIRLENLYFDCTGIDAVVAPFDVNAADFTMVGCEILMADACGQATECILTVAAADRMRIWNNVFRAPNAGANNAISIVGTPDGIEIIGNRIYGDFADACIHNPTGNVATNLVIEGNYLQNDNAGEHAIELVSACTGNIECNKFVTDAIATAADLGSCYSFDNWFYDSSDTDVAGVPWPVAKTTGVAYPAADIPYGANPFGEVFYVAASGGSDTAVGGGRDRKAPLATIAQAITNAAAADTIVLGPGTHSVDVSAAALTPLADQRFVAAIPPNGGKPSTIVTADADDGADLWLIDVDGVVIEGIEFLLVAGGTTAVRLCAVSQTTAVNGLTIKDCWFNLADVDVALIALAIHDATNATTGLSVQGCRFIGGSSTTGQVSYIQVGVGGCVSSVIEGCTFELESADADCYGVDFLDNAAAANKSYGLTIRNNDFFGPLDAGADGVGIFLAAAGTELEWLAMARTNYFAFCSATPITIDKMNKGAVWNYVGDNATGGTLVDPGT